MSHAGPGRLHQRGMPREPDGAGAHAFSDLAAWRFCCVLWPTLTLPPAAMLLWRISRSTSTSCPALMMAFSRELAQHSATDDVGRARGGGGVLQGFFGHADAALDRDAATRFHRAASMAPLTTASPVTRTSMVAAVSPRTL